MPTVHREGAYRFFFYSADRNEPPHVHVEREANRAKFWLSPVRDWLVAEGLVRLNFCGSNGWWLRDRHCC